MNYSRNVMNDFNHLIRRWIYDGKNGKTYARQKNANCRIEKDIVRYLKRKLTSNGRIR
jgi:hypothetical protein